MGGGGKGYTCNMRIVLRALLQYNDSDLCNISIVIKNHFGGVCIYYRQYASCGGDDGCVYF